MSFDSLCILYIAIILLWYLRLWMCAYFFSLLVKSYRIFRTRDLCFIWFRWRSLPNFLNISRQLLLSNHQQIKGRDARHTQKETSLRNLSSGLRSERSSPSFGSLWGPIRAPDEHERIHVQDTYKKFVERSEETLHSPCNTGNSL